MPEENETHEYLQETPQDNEVAKGVVPVSTVDAEILSSECEDWTSRTITLDGLGAVGGINKVLAIWENARD
jgi:hypothetical protein